MRSINNNTSLGNQPSDNIIYTGKPISCLSTNCTNVNISSIIEGLGDITCFNYSQINSLTSVNTYCKNIGCDAKTFVNLFNSLFQTTCTLENSLLNIVIGEKPIIKYMGTCLDDNVTVTLPDNTIQIAPEPINTQFGNIPYQRECVWASVNGVWTLQSGVPNVPIKNFCFFSTDATCTACNQFDLKDFYQNIVTNIQNLNYENYKIYQEICSTKGQIFNSLNNIISQSGTIYLDDIILNSCTGSFLPYTLPLTPLSTSIKPAINLLADNICTTQTILGNYSDVTRLWDYVRTLRCADSEGLIPDYTLDLHPEHGIGSAPGVVNTIQYIRVLFNSVCNLNNRFNILTNTLNDCCKTDCDVCLQYGLSIKEFNYGMFTSGATVAIPGNIITDNSKPQIVFQENITINCNGDQLDNNISKYIISDGVTVLSYSLQDLITGVPGITLVSGTVGNNAIFLLDLQALGLSYLANITIRQKLRTVVNKCDSSDKILIPGFSGRECGKCTVCLVSLSDTCDISDFPIPNAIFTYNGETYYLDLSNPCITVPLYKDNYGRPIPIVGVNYNCEKLQLTSECSEFGLPPYCPTSEETTDTVTENCKWFIDFSNYNIYHFGVSDGSGVGYTFNSNSSQFIISYKENNGTLVKVTSPLLHSYDSDSARALNLINTLSSIGATNIVFDSEALIVEFCISKDIFLYNAINIINIDVSSDATFNLSSPNEDKQIREERLIKLNSSFTKICDCCTSCQ